MTAKWQSCDQVISYTQRAEYSIVNFKLVRRQVEYFWNNFLFELRASLSTNTST